MQPIQIWSMIRINEFFLSLVMHGGLVHLCDSCRSGPWVMLLWLRAGAGGDITSHHEEGLIEQSRGRSVRTEKEPCIPPSVIITV